MRALRTKAPDGVNQPTRWHNNLRPWLDLQHWQKQIDKRIGLNKRGLSIVVLRWGQEITTRCWGAETPRYWTKRQLNPSGLPTYWTVPRWMYEKILEPEQYVDSWTATRYSLHDPTVGGSPRCQDCGCDDQPVLVKDRIYCRKCAGTDIVGGQVIDKGPPPERYYTYLMDASTHEAIDPNTGWAHCCTRAFYTDRSRCWGRYRNPNDLDLQVIEQMAQKMAEDKFQDPYRVLTTAELAEIEIASMKQVERAQEQFDAYEKEMRDDFNKLHGWRVTETDAGAHHHGHFFDQAKANRAHLEARKKLFLSDQSTGIVITDN